VRIELAPTSVADSPKPPALRISFALPMLSTARASVLLATGEPKLKALERLLAGDPSLPASALEKVVVVTDRRPPRIGRSN
jgi:6-phosphogluconolactonase/glucosamine-6-phosphate isomerase/deaminase